MPETAPTWPVISENPRIQAFYERCRANGESHNMAKMFAERRAPGVVTDTTFMAGRRDEFNGNNVLRRIYMERARAAGVNPTGKVYSGGLARFPGDPKAWINDRSDVERIARDRGVRVEGSINCDYLPEDMTDPFNEPYRVADELVEDEIDRIETESGEPVTGAKREDAREKIREQITPKIGE